MKFTILGSSGFIGSHLTKFLTNNGIDCITPDIKTQDLSTDSLGHVIYSIGITSDFRNKPLETVDSHVCTLKNILEKAKFESFLYLSSTRIYKGLNSSSEDEPLIVNPNNFEHIYNISKIMGESLCLTQKNSNIKIARLSNVFGQNFEGEDFLPSLIKEVIKNKKITLHTSEESEKDFIDITDVVKILPEIATKGKYRIYNVASGKNTKTKDIINEISKYADFTVHKTENSPIHSFPKISIERIKTEFEFMPHSILENIESLIRSYNSRYQND